MVESNINVNLSNAVTAVKAGMDVQRAAEKYGVRVEEINQALQSGLNGCVAEQEGVGDFTNFSNTSKKEDSDSSWGWAVGLGAAAVTVAGLALHKNLGGLTKHFSKLENWQNVRKMKGMNAVQLEDGSYYAQSLVDFKNGERVTTHLKDHITDASQMERNPWTGNWSKTLLETRYNPSTGLMETVESNGGRFSTLTSTSASGERVYSAVSADGTIVYKGYDKNFKAIPGVEQSVTCLDKEGKVIKEFKGSEINFAKHSSSDYSQDYSARCALDVSSLKTGPLSVDRYSVGEFRNLARDMEGQIYRGRQDIVRNASYKARELAHEVPDVAEAKKAFETVSKSVRNLETQVKTAETELEHLPDFKRIKNTRAEIQRLENNEGTYSRMKFSTRQEELSNLKDVYRDSLEKIKDVGKYDAYKTYLKYQKELEELREVFDKTKSVYNQKLSDELLKLS